MAEPIWLPEDKPGVIRQWLAERRRREEAAVLAAIAMLRPSWAGGSPIALLARLSVARVYVVLARLEKSGRVTSGWADGPHPRRRVYRAVRP